ncbi:MAG: type IV pilus secretin PilQ [Candidatus Accumulibacter sp.]|jgi:type IV pilus assembly protein PilQ|nr:type IV pilus secretin PilQ [Accumulibacter sp.]
MKRIGYYVFGLAALVMLPGSGNAQEAGPGPVNSTNAIESMQVVKQGGVVNFKLTFRDPLTAPPSGFSVASPARIALDFPNTTNGTGKTAQTFNEGDLKSVNIAQTGDRARVVLNLNVPMNYEPIIEDRVLLLALAPNAGKAWQDGGIDRPVEHFSQARAAVANGIRDIEFRRGRNGEARILVDMDDSNSGIDIRQQGQSLIVDFINVSVPESLRKKLDVIDFATPVVSVSTVQQGPNARMTIAPKGQWEHNAYQTDNQFVIEVVPVVEDPNKLVQGSRGGYQGDKLSLNFQNVPVRQLLQVFGEFTGLNVVVSDSVGGSITLILKDVPWDQALDIVMQQKGLDMRKNGNVILVAPREEIATKEKLEYESRVQINDLEPLHTESFQMNYIKGADVKKLLADPKQTILSKRGSALLDDRSNILFVQDTSSRLDDVRAMIAKVDIPVRQVMIEARIVEASDSFAKNLGVRLTQGSARLGSDGIIMEPITGGSSGQITRWVNPTNGFGYGSVGGLNLPATPRTGTPATFSFSLFNSKYTKYLDFEISALEADGRGKIVSSPRVMTANQVEALIEQGVEIPYQEASSSGATSVSFRKANLSLKVKPQITPDGRVTMSLDINKDTPNTSLSTGSGVAIDTKHVKTEVLVENGGTVVIGGIYTQTISNSTTRVPFFGDLPYIGWLFKNHEWIDDKTELLVFITPKIVAEGLALR